MVGKWTLRLLRMAQLSISDPEFPDKSLLRELELLIWQSNEQWEMLHHNAPDPACGKIDEPHPAGTCSLAARPKPAAHPAAVI